MTKLYEYLKKDESIFLNKLSKDIQKNCQPFIKEFKSSNVKYFLYRATKKNIKFYDKIIPRKDRKPRDTPLHIHKLIDDIFKDKFGWKPRSEGVFVNPNKTVISEYGNAYIFIPIGKYEYLWSPKIDDLYNEIKLTIRLKCNLPIKEITFEKFKNIDKFKIEYEKYKEPESLGGSWWYKNIDTGYTKKYNAIDYLKKFKNIKEDEMEIYMSDDFRWIPKMTFEKFIEKKYRELMKTIEKIIKEKAETYKTNNLKELVLTINEAMFKCNSYYLINPNFFEKLKNNLF